MNTSKDLQHKILEELDWEPSVDAAHIGVAVTDSVVTLSGSVSSYLKKMTAERAAKRIAGVRGVSNNITIIPVPRSADIKTRIEAAFRHSAEIDARNVQVETDGDKVILRGKVRNWAEREEAERAAWAARGVAQVADKLTI